MGRLGNAGRGKMIGSGGVGLVSTKIARMALPVGGFRLESGAVLSELDIAYETYGELSPKRDNVIFICPTLTSDAHAAGYHSADDPAPGWWDEMIGPGKGIDTRHYFVVCANILGGCKGTTGPSSRNPETGKPYGSAFPSITVGDMVEAHRHLLKSLGIERLAGVIGGSLGGMQALEWAIRYPDSIDRCVCIACGKGLSAQALAFDIVGRKAITSDPAWLSGDYYGENSFPTNGLSLARKIGHITYLSPEMMETRFGRGKLGSERSGAEKEAARREFRSDFEVESYLEHQGNKFIERFDANSYLHITLAMDRYDIIERYGSLESAFEPIKAKILVVALSADWLFPSEQSVEIASALLRVGKNVSYCELHAPHGHDAFLVDIKHLGDVVRAFLPWVEENGTSGDSAETAGEADKTGGPTDRKCHCGRNEFHIIMRMIRPRTRVVDIGCGGGELLAALASRLNISGLGVDFDIQHVINVIDKGHDVFQEDIDAGLAMIPDGAYDYAILGETLQVVRKPRFVLNEMLRVAREGIVTFPNFGKWSHRLRLLLSGRMPKGGALPYEWYDTPNIHLFTLKDFIEICRRDNIKIHELAPIPAGLVGKLLVSAGLYNPGADRVLARIAREPGS